MKLRESIHNGLKVTQKNFYEARVDERKVMNISIFTDLTHSLMGIRVSSTVILQLYQKYRSDLKKKQRKYKLNICRTFRAVERIDWVRVIIEFGNEM